MVPDQLNWFGIDPSTKPGRIHVGEECEQAIRRVFLTAMSSGKTQEQLTPLGSALAGALGGVFSNAYAYILMLGQAVTDTYYESALYTL